jgi:2-keto-4-pentenoate hydratase/2-oxohepta-3-ene-1,7-dioic acid hydratase in catechol pathway|tara:strand:- start:163 stop:939 length:777 start_codon:yes stop_codon:yes gene_type:complete
MKIARVKYEKEIFYGEVIEDSIKRYEGSPLVFWEATEEMYQLDEVQTLSPVLPSKVVAVAKNYRKHAHELGVLDYHAPENPVFFIKPSTSVIGTGESIIYPSIGKHVDHEAELAIVIGKLSKNLNKDTWMDNVLGITIANDLSERILQGQDGSFNGNFTRAKSFDTFCPLGPVIQTDFDKEPNLNIQCSVNGELKQDGNTVDMIFSIGEILSFVTSIMTLLPGDVLLTGTPDGVGPVVPGDEVHAKIDTIGDLINPIK